MPIREPVRGSTGTEYHLYRTPDGSLRCTCPDHRYRQRPCKHIIAHKPGQATLRRALAFYAAQNQIHPEDLLAAFRVIENAKK